MNTDYLRNYILRSIIVKAHINKETGEFTMCETRLPDDLLASLIKECGRYGMNDNEARVFISQTAASVNASPSIVEVYETTSVKDIPVGEHLRLMFNTDEWGKLAAELLCSDGNTFRILSTDIPGLAPFDSISSELDSWNTDCTMSFKVKRNGKSYPNEKTSLRIAKYNHMVKYNPAFIYTVLDTDMDFSYEAYIIRSNIQGTRYVNTVDRKDKYFVFHTKEEDKIPRAALFAIIPNQEPDTATLYPNVPHINQLIRNGQTDTAGEIIGCCMPDNGQTTLSQSAHVECVEPGVLQCVDITSADTYWIVTSKPVIRITYGNNTCGNSSLFPQEGLSSGSATGNITTPKSIDSIVNDILECAREGIVEKKYDEFRAICVRSGVSCYALHLLIQTALKHQSDTGNDTAATSNIFYVNTDLQKENEELKREVERLRQAMGTGKKV